MESKDKPGTDAKDQKDPQPVPPEAPEAAPEAPEAPEEPDAANNGTIKVLGKITPIPRTRTTIPIDSSVMSISDYRSYLRENAFMVATAVCFYIFFTVLGLVAYTKTSSSAAVSFVSLVGFILGIFFPLFQIIPIAIYVFGGDCETTKGAACGGHHGGCLDGYFSEVDQFVQS